MTLIGSQISRVVRFQQVLPSTAAGRPQRAGAALAAGRSGPRRSREWSSCRGTIRQGRPRPPTRPAHCSRHGRKMRLRGSCQAEIALLDAAHRPAFAPTSRRPIAHASVPATASSRTRTANSHHPLPDWPRSRPNVCRCSTRKPLRRSVTHMSPRTPHRDALVARARLAHGTRKTSPNAYVDSS